MNPTSPQRDSTSDAPRFQVGSLVTHHAYRGYYRVVAVDWCKQNTTRTDGYYHISTQAHSVACDAYRLDGPENSFEPKAVQS